MFLCIVLPPSSTGRRFGKYHKQGSNTYKSWICLTPILKKKKKRDPSRLLTDHKSLGLLIGCNFCPDSVGKRFDHCLYSVSLWITLLPPVRESYAHESPEQLSLQQREISLEFLLLEPSFFLSETLRDIMLPKAQARRKSFSTPWTSSLATCAMRTSKR